MVLTDGRCWVCLCSSCKRTCKPSQHLRRALHLRVSSLLTPDVLLLRYAATEHS